jgi:hypothetical protein
MTPPQPTPWMKGFDLGPRSIQDAIELLRALHLPPPFVVSNHALLAQCSRC